MMQVLYFYSFLRHFSSS